MAITTLDGAIAGMQYPKDFSKAVTGTLVAGRLHSLFYLADWTSDASGSYEVVYKVTDGSRITIGKGTFKIV